MLLLNTVNIVIGCVIGSFLLLVFRWDTGALLLFGFSVGFGFGSDFGVSNYKENLWIKKNTKRRLKENAEAIAVNGARLTESPVFSQKTIEVMSALEILKGYAMEEKADKLEEVKDELESKAYIEEDPVLKE
jgi:hypothetical protein